MSKKVKAGGQQEAALDYLVITVGELDELVNRQLVKDNAARKPNKGEQTYVITDKEKARSNLIMPKVLDPYGKEGWNLVAVNKMECYIFRQGAPVEYRVETPPDIDRLAIRYLQSQGHLKLSGFEGQTPALEVINPEAAKIQLVLPNVLSEYEKEGWKLAAINGPQLYFFIRPINS